MSSQYRRKARGSIDATMEAKTDTTDTTKTNTKVKETELDKDMKNTTTETKDDDEHHIHTYTQISSLKLTDEEYKIWTQLMTLLLERQNK